jgi:uncharacterized protein YkwD
MEVTPEKPVRKAGRVRSMAVAVIVALAVVALPGQAHANEAGDAWVAVDLINETRAAYGLDWLTPDRELQVVANRQAAAMADSGYAFHSSNLGDQLSWGWWGWAENVGVGPSIGWLHGAFMGSWSHADTILSSKYNYVGVGVAYGWDGRVYIAQVFGAW